MTQSMKAIKPMQATQENIIQRKKTNILFIYHRLDVIGGIETRLIDEFNYLHHHNFNVHFFIDENNFNPDLAVLLPHCHLLTAPFADIRNATEFINLVEHIVFQIETYHIDIVSIQMQNLFGFAATIAAQLCQVAVISTTHGILEMYQTPMQKLIQKLVTKSFYLNIFVSHLPASASSLCQTNNKMIIPNLINLTKYKALDKVEQSSASWLMVSRISPEKFPSILEFIKVAHHCQIQEIHIAGGGNFQPLLDRLDKELNTIKIKFLGECTNIPELLPKYSLIAGMGRVAIEGLACQKPVCIITPNGKLKGLVTVDNFVRIQNYNFTGNTLKTITIDEFKTQLESYTEIENKAVYGLLTDNLSTEKWHDYIEQYKSVQFIENPTLNRLFHKMSYFANQFTSPFEKDELFQQLFYESLLESDNQDMLRMWDFYHNSLGLNTKYPNPYRTKKRRKWKF